MPVEFTIEQQGLQSLGRALKAEEDGKKLRRDLGKNMRAALEPAIGEIRSGLMAMATSGPSGSPPLRATVSSKIRAEARLSGRSTGARIRAKKTPGLRDFANAPKRLNRKKGWRRRVFGSDVWVQQYGPIEYFDQPIQQHRDEYRDAVLDAMEDTARRIAERSR